MEQMYLIEIFIEKVTIFPTEEDTSSANKNLIVKVQFGPNVQFIIKEGQLAVNEKQDDIMVMGENGRPQWSRTIRVGKSYLFPSFPDTILMILSNFPLELEVWNDDASEPDHLIYVGVGNMHWHTRFFHMLKETSNTCKMHQPLSIKTKATLMAECCCRQAGEVEFILRLSALGSSIITEFQQMLKDPESFVFRTNKAPSMFTCKRVENDDPNFCMVGSLYETTTLEDPDMVDKANKKIEVCTELQSCGMGGKSEYTCDFSGDKGTAKKKIAIDKIRMGDIIGPCGNANCALAHKVRMYIRGLESYKKKTTGMTDTKPINARKVCGTCVCKDDRFHREGCPENTVPKVQCTGCGGMTAPGSTCEERKNKEFGTGATPKTSQTQVTYLFSTTQFPNYKQGMFGHDTIVEDCYCSQSKSLANADGKACTSTSCSDDWASVSVGTSSCSKPTINKSTNKTFESKSTMLSCGVNNPVIYNVNTSKSYQSCRSQTKSPNHVSSTGTNYTSTCSVCTSTGSQVAGPSMGNQIAGPSTANQENRKVQVYYVTDLPEEKDCKCTPKKPAPPCRTFDCECLVETQNKIARKLHKPYCPLYKHKVGCPVTMHEEEEVGHEDEVEEVAPLPYGLPPIRLGPCPVLGRPCSVPDGFARMYKNALVPTQPFSYSNDGKICCSKEFERIKKAIKEYMKNDKESDFRCLNTFNVDTERRCCDKEQVLMSLLGKDCCGPHKLSIQEKYEKAKK